MVKLIPDKPKFIDTPLPRHMEPTPQDEELAKKVLEFVKQHTTTGFKGRAQQWPVGTARWDEVQDFVKQHVERYHEEHADFILNLLMDRGLLYEPILGVLKVS